MPIIGLGTFQIKDLEFMKNVLTTAINVGYRHIDTAFSYSNENLIGAILTEMFNKGEIKREDLFIVSKLPLNGMKPDAVEYFCNLSLTALQLDYVDLYLLHFPVPSKRSDKDKEVIVIKDGVFVTDNINLTDTWKVSIANLQVLWNVTLIFHSMNSMNFVRKLNIALTAYSPLGCPGFPEFALKDWGVNAISLQIETNKIHRDKGLEIACR
ncbi:aldo-keto reductase family 1 member C13 [Trichonephila clavipes]|nr:aldo-keto reductase family 1 member C13 [Trichonephila clavipes]